RDPACGSERGETNSQATHVEVLVDAPSDAGSIPAASILTCGICGLRGFDNRERVPGTFQKKLHSRALPPAVASRTSIRVNDIDPPGLVDDPGGGRERA